jgi:ATP-dependent RNA helicase DDX49/DBP8
MTTEDDGDFMLFKPKKVKTLVEVENTINTETPSVPDTTISSSVLEVQSKVELANNFLDLGLPAWQVDTLKGLAISKPTAIQSACIPAILSGRDVIGGAKTGSGKTAAFALPILKLLAEDIYGPFALILTPTRELALQIAEQFQVLGKALHVNICVVLGGCDMMRQASDLARRPHIIVATPGRLVDLLQSSPDCLDLKKLRFCVLDEADRLLDPQSTFQKLGEVPKIMEHVKRSRNVQMLLFSATLTDSVQQSLIPIVDVDADADNTDTDNCMKTTRNVFAFHANDSHGTVDSIEQKYLLVPSKVRDCYLYHLLMNELAGKTMIIFVGKCLTAELLRFWLREVGIEVAALHSQLAQPDRIAALARFKSGQLPILISTDVGSRGLDIPSVQVVLNYDVPLDARDYVHRIGRTARAGRSGFALTLMTEMDCELVENIEAKIGKQLIEFPEPLEEKVLEKLNKIGEAKRVASMALSDRKFGEKRAINKKKWGNNSKK